MRTPSLIQERQKSWVDRKKAKKNHDSILNLSNSESPQLEIGVELKVKESNGTYTSRLLDEGMVVYSDGSPRSYLQKGTIQEFYDALPDDYVGYINSGHVDFATNPIFLGSWTKENLTIVDIGDGRKGLDITFELDNRLSKVKDLKLMAFDMAVSSEFDASINWDVMELMGVDYPIFNHIFIYGFAIVGDPGNINSAGLKLKGENEMTKEKSFFEGLFSKPPKKDTKEKEENTNLATNENPFGELTVEKMAEIADEFERLKTLESEAVEMAEKGVKLFNELEDTKKQLKEANEKLANYEETVPSVFERFATIANDLGEKQDKKQQEMKNEELSGWEQALEKLKAAENKGDE